jgi:hypothetical protein
MITKRSISTVLLAIQVGPSCSSLPSELEPFDGDFSYTAFDDEGTRVLDGTLRLEVRSNGSLSGSWEIKRVAGTDPETVVGPQVGEGELVGSIEEGQLIVNLNPGFADNNVGLVGVVEDQAIMGTWSYVTFAGPTAGGDFTAEKLR